tara:strand:- start:699 stop:1217 length:519 start_codon:yes stop_codon:yes gene_type:complete
MEQSAKPSDVLLVTTHGHTACVRVEGRATFKVSGSLKKFILGAADSGTTRVILDMDHCIAMDSTFMGVLAGIAMQFQAGDRHLMLINLHAETVSLLETLGLDRLLETHTPLTTEAALKAELGVPEDFSKLSASAESDTLQMILEAHENLIDASPSNAPKFEDVISYLRKAQA